MKRRALLGATLAAAASGCTAACAATFEAPLPKVTIAGGAPGGVYHELAKAFAAEIRRRWRIPADVLPSNESIDNLRMVAQGRADIGFATVDLCELALQGDSPFTGVLQVAALASVYEDYLQIIVSEESRIAQVRDLVRYRVSLGAEDSGAEFVAQRILRAAGLAPGDITKLFHLPADEAATQMRAGNLDAFFVMGGLPTPSVLALAEKMKVGVLSIPDEADYLRATTESDLYLSRSIPAGTYGIGSEKSTLGVGNVIVIHKDASDETAFRLTELLLAAKPSLVKAHPEARRLDPRTAVATFRIPLHRGALRYYRETKPYPGTAR